MLDFSVPHEVFKCTQHMNGLTRKEHGKVRLMQEGGLQGPGG